MTKRSRARSVSVLARLVIVSATVAAPAITTRDDGPCALDDALGRASALDAVLVLDSSEHMSASDPDGLRTSLSIAFVNGMESHDRAAVVDFDDEGQLVQGLTENKQALVASIGTINENGGADLGAGVGAALRALSADAKDGRRQVVIVMTDGKVTYEASTAADAADSGVKIHTIGVGSSVNGALLTLAAASTGGTYTHAEPSEAAPTPSEPLQDDADRDGLTDCQEIRGAYDADGELHVTEADHADTDGDGLTDGQEVSNDLAYYGASSLTALLHTTLGVAGYRVVVADPNDPDSDGDGSEDALEFDVGTDPYASDSDDDGLDDFAEVDVLGTDPLDKNTDGDGRDDGWEVEHVSAGFDPTVYDEEQSKWSYAGDFVRGATCPEGVELCESESLAFLAGSLAGGVLGYKDILDIIGNLTDLDFVGAGLSVTALVPGAGDSASFVSKSVRFINRVPARKKTDAVAFIAKADSVPQSFRTEILQFVDRQSLDQLRSQGMTDEAILALAGNRVPIRTLAQAIRGASKVENSPRLFARESDAEDYLRARTLGALPGQVSFAPPGGSARNALGSRRPDIYSLMTKSSIEVKNGYVNLTDHVREEIARDVALFADPNTEITSVAWHFFPKESGSVGMSDEVRDLLESSRIPYVVYLP